MKAPKEQEQALLLVDVTLTMMTQQDNCKQSMCAGKSEGHSVDPCYSGGTYYDASMLHCHLS